MEIRTATPSVAIVQSSLADRGPDLAIANVMVMTTMAFLGGGRSPSMRVCFHDGSERRRRSKQMARIIA
jgi:hypothetical protein